MRTDSATSKPFEIVDYKAEDAEIKRASQENNYIYSLMKKAESGSCNAIKKLLGYSMINFSPDVEFAAKLMEEAREMITKAYDIYTNGAGELSDISINAAKQSTIQNSDRSMTDEEKQQAYNKTINDMQCSIS